MEIGRSSLFCLPTPLWKMLELSVSQMVTQIATNAQPLIAEPNAQRVYLTAKLTEMMSVATHVLMVDGNKEFIPECIETTA